MIKLSFIVPIYNVKEYLQKCVDSLVTQGYEDYEIVLVDDGSTDGSGELADEICQINEKRKTSNKRVRVIHQANRGLSGARNAGVEAAIGEYVCFVDSDDYWEPHVLGGLMEQVEREDLDVLRFRWQNVRVAGSGVAGSGGEYEVFQPYKDAVDYNDYSGVPVDGVTFLNERMAYRCYVVQFVVKRELLISSQLSAVSGQSSAVSSQCLFTEGILFEDVDWTPRMLMRAKRAASVDTVVYNYLWRENGITLSKSPEKVKKEVENKLALVAKLKGLSGEMAKGRRVESRGTSDESWFEGMISSLVVSVVGILSGAMWNERKTYLAQTDSLHILPLSERRIAPKAARKVKLININIRLAVWLLHLKK